MLTHFQAHGLHFSDACWLGGRQNLHWAVRLRREPAVLRRWYADAPDTEYELRVLEQVAARGWPVPVPLSAALFVSGACWSLFSFLPGAAPLREAMRERGRLLATFHAQTAGLGRFGRRPGWQPVLEVLSDPATEPLLEASERRLPAEVRALRWHLHRARTRLAQTMPPEPDGPGQLIHGDFTSWNLRVQDGRLSGLLDFEFARPEHRLAEFALAWRGQHDEVVLGYHDLAPLSDTEWALLTPYWWAHLIGSACQILARGEWDDGWTLQMLLRRSPLMGEDASAYTGT